MPTLPGPNNAIAYAQFRLQGGWRGTLLVGGICLAVLVALVGLSAVSAATAGRPPAAATYDWPQGLVGLQVLFLLIIGPLRVTSAVRGDVNSRMLESHRLMPLSPAAAVAGYAGGAPWTLLVLAAVTFAVGTACCWTGGADASRFLLANLVLGFVSVCVWVAATYLSMASRIGVLVLVVLGLFAASVDGGPAELMPALEVLAAPLITRSVIPLRGGGGGGVATTATVTALAAQAVLAAVCFRAAMRLYRAPGSIGLNAPLGLVILAVWVAMSAVGLVLPEEFGMFQHRSRDVTPPARLVASTVAALLVAGLPVAAAARGAEQRHRSTDAPDRRPAWGVWATVAAAVTLVTALPAVASRYMPDLPFYTHVQYGNGLLLSGRETAAVVRQAVHLTPAVICSAVLGLTFVVRLAYVRFDRAWLVLAVWVFVAWTGPLMVDALTSVDPQYQFGRVASLSPIGALIELWAQTGGSPARGIELQFAVAAVPLLFYALAVVRRRRSTVTAASSAA